MTDPLRHASRYPIRATRQSPPLRQRRRGRSVVVLMLLLLLWSICLGYGLALATEPAQVTPIEPTPEVAQPISVQSSSAQAIDPPVIGTVDEVPERFQLGKKLYLETCATCHVGIPPEVMPSETWRQLLPDPQHYGLTLKPLENPNLRVVWEYLRTYSRPQAADETIPYRVYQSRFFKALHPRVDLPTKAGLNTCISCHPGGDRYNFRTLSAEWQNAP